MPKASVIIPVYNGEKYLRETVMSAAEQTLRDIEIIIVDDGSTDTTPEICARLAGADERVKVIRKQNGGVGSARNTGLAAAEGEYVFFSDADDIMLPDLLMASTELAEKSAADIVIFGHEIAEGDKVLSRRPALDGVFTRDEAMAELTRVVNYSLTVWTRLYRRSFLLDNGLSFNGQRIGEDAVFNLNALGRDFKRLAISHDIHYRHISRSGSAMTKFRPEVYDEEYAVAAALESVVRGCKTNTEANRRLVARFYARSVSIFLGIMAEKGCPLSRREKLALLKKIMSEPKIKESFALMNPTDFSGKTSKIKALLLKHGFYGAVITLGEMKKRW